MIFKVFSNLNDFMITASENGKWNLLCKSPQVCVTSVLSNPSWLGTWPELRLSLPRRMASALCWPRPQLCRTQLQLNKDKNPNRVSDLKKCCDAELKHSHKYRSISAVKTGFCSPAYVSPHAHSEGTGTPGPAQSFRDFLLLTSS